jgi:hypothetical protein
VPRASSDATSPARLPNVSHVVPGADLVAIADALELPPVPIEAVETIAPATVADARRDGCEDVDTDRLGLAPDEIPIRSADPHS